MKVKICDSIMGSGKSTCAINQMNEDVAYKYIYVTPYLNEAARIAKACSSRGFVTPKNNGNGKLDNLNQLLSNNRNIASTHSLFSRYTPETVELIRKGGYKLILDEVIPAVERIHISRSDLKLCIRSGALSADENGIVRWEDKGYSGGVFDDIKDYAEGGNLVLHKDEFLFWIFPIEVFDAFEEVIVLTYLFGAQVQRYYYEMKNVSFEYIYTKQNSDGSYEFSTEMQLLDYVAELPSKIHILEDEALNAVGEDKYALSSTWFGKQGNKKKIVQLRKNIANYFKHKIKGWNMEKVKVTAEGKMWTTFVESEKVLSQKGYKGGFVAWNAKATNEYRHKRFVAYCVNIFFDPMLKNFFLDQSIDVNEDEYALSQMLQFIWRSAIRDNEEIWIYIPSSRMRNLLKGWLWSLSCPTEPYVYDNSEIKTIELIRTA